MSMFRSPSLRVLRRALRLIMQSAPRELRRLVVLNMLFGAGPTLLLYLGKLVIDQTSQLLAAPSATQPLTLLLTRPVLLWSIIAFIVINTLLDSLETVSSFEWRSLTDRLQGVAKAQIYAKVAEFDDIALFESPPLLNTLQLAQTSIPRLTQLATVLTNLMTGVFVFIPAFLLSASIAWWIPALIFLTALPSVWVQLRYENKSWSVEYAQADVVRQMAINERVLTSEEYAKELRQFRLQALILERWRGLFWSAFDEMRTVRARGVGVMIGWSLLSGLGAGLPYLYVVMAAIGGRYTLGDLALYAGLVFQVRRSLFILWGNVANLQEIVLASASIFRLLDLQPTLRPIAPDRSAARETHGITIAGVSFAYPGSDHQVLREIDLAIQPGEMLVIVGENGAGKTTLAKLLSRLYDPDAGTITWDGQDIRSIDLQTLRRQIAVVNQDFARFPTTFGENIGFGQLELLKEDNALQAAATSAGIGALIERLPQGLGTPLSKQLEHGVDLSGGQWQRVAIARALLRHHQSRLLILDEPTASLDPQTEHEIFAVFRAMARDKIAVIISHRLALARIADRVVVIEGGRIIETGTHDELLAHGGPYSVMFQRQASSYLASQGANDEGQD